MVKTSNWKKLNQWLGILFAYLLFSIILFFTLSFLGKFPEGFTYFHVFGVTLILSILGFITKGVFKWDSF